MGVVKNLMVRIGANVGGMVTGMKKASSATKEARDSINRNTTNIKKTVSDSFGGTKNAVRSYSETVKSTRQAHEVAKQNVTRLADKVGSLKSTFTTVKAATAGLDLGKSLSEQMVEAEKALTSIEQKRRKVEQDLASITSPKAAASKRTASLQAELKQLAQKSEIAVSRLAHLDRIAETLGQENIGHASAAGLEKLRQQIINTENELKTAQMAVDETGKKLKGLKLGPTVGRAVKSLGGAAAQAAKNGVAMLARGVKKVGTAAGQVALSGIRRLASGLKSLGAAALRGIASLPGKLLRIGKSASSGAGGVGKLVRQIRNVGVVSLGLRVAGGMFGRLRSIISSYISANEELNAATATLTRQLGQALEPAIRLVMAAMQQLMPVVQKVSSAINAVLKSIIGDVGEVQYAMSSLGTYGFDQITKADEETEGSTAEQEQSALVTKLTGWIAKLKNAFVSGDWDGLGKLVGDSINKAFGALNDLDVGAKLGNFTNNLTTTLHSLFATIDFAGIGQTAAKLLGDGIANVNWAAVGEVIGLAMTALPTAAISFITSADWHAVGQSALTVLQSAMGVVSEWVHGTDWLRIGQSVQKFIDNTDWTAIPQKMLGLLGDAFGGVNFASIGDMVAQGFNWVVGKLFWVTENFDWTGLATTLTRNINDVINGADWRHFGQTLSSLISTTLQTLTTTALTFNWKGLGAGIASCINGLDWAGMLSNLAGSVSAILKGALDLLIGFAKKLDWAKLGSDLWNGVIGVISGIDWGSVLSKVYELLGSAIGGIGSTIVTFWASVATSLAQALDSAWTYFETFIDEAGGNVGKGILNAIVAAFKNIGTWVQTNLWGPFKDGLNSTFSGTGDALGKIFEKIPEKLKTPINTVLGFINSMISGVCDGINSMIRALNSLSFNIPDWVPILGGKTFGLNIKEVVAPQIPLLAKGGIVDGPTQLIAGEKGKEAIVPLENNTGWIDKVADKITTKQSGGGSGQPMIVQVFLGKRKLTEYVIQDINQITKSTGVCPIKV